MGKFCTSCGISLVDNEVCPCMQSGEENMSTKRMTDSIEVSIDPTKITNYLSDLGNLLLRGLTNPISTLNYLLSSNLIPIAVGLNVISLIFTTILLNMISENKSDFSSILSFLNYKFYNNEFSVLFKLSLIINFLPILILGIVTLAIGYCFTKKIKMSQIVLLTGGMQFTLILSQVVAMFLVFIFPTLTIPVILIGITLSMIICYEGINKVYNLNKDLSLLFLGANYVTSFVVYTLVIESIIESMF